MANILDFGFKRFDEGRTSHRLSLDDVIVEEQLDLIDRRQDMGSGLAIGDDCERHLANKIATICY